jgi:hypothetical protein
LISDLFDGLAIGPLGKGEKLSGNGFQGLKLLDGKLNILGNDSDCTKYRLDLLDVFSLEVLIVACNPTILASVNFADDWALIVQNIVRNACSKEAEENDGLHMLGLKITLYKTDHNLNWKK